MATYSSILAWRIPMDRGAWWATWVTKSQTQLKPLRTHTEDNMESSGKASRNIIHQQSILFSFSLLCPFFFFGFSSMFIFLSSNNQTHINPLRMESSSTSTALPLLESLNFNLGLLIASEPLLYWCNYYYKSREMFPTGSGKGSLDHPRTALTTTKEERTEMTHLKCLAQCLAHIRT